MNKKLIAITLVLMLVTSGLFALDLSTLPTPTATLKATLGDYFHHGFVNGAEFEATKTVTNAFGSTAPSFDYGYETNATGPFYIKMAVSDFVNVTPNSTGTVKIKAISVSGSTPQWDNTEQKYTIFTIPASNTFTRNVTTITVTPALTTADTVDHLGETIPASETAAQAASGEYEATLTFSVSAS